MKRGQFRDEPRRQMKIELGYLSGGLGAQTNLPSLEDHKKVFTEIDCFGFVVLVDRDSKAL